MIPEYTYHLLSACASASNRNNRIQVDVYATYLIVSFESAHWIKLRSCLPHLLTATSHRKIHQTGYISNEAGGWLWDMLCFFSPNYNPVEEDYRHNQRLKECKINVWVFIQKRSSLAALVGKEFLLRKRNRIIALAKHRIPSTTNIICLVS